MKKLLALLLTLFVLISCLGIASCFYNKIEGTYYFYSFTSSWGGEGKVGDFYDGELLKKENFIIALKKDKSCFYYKDGDYYEGSWIKDGKKVVLLLEDYGEAIILTFNKNTLTQFTDYGYEDIKIVYKK